MKAIVCFRAPGGNYAVPVEQVSSVRPAAEITPLPSPRPGVVGLVSFGEKSLSVLSVLGSESGHVMLVEDDGLSFGLLVEEVTGVQQIDEATIGPPPPGQDRAVVGGVLSSDDALVMMLDLTVLRGRLVG